MNTLAEPGLIAIDPREARKLGAASLISYGKIFFPRSFRQKSPEMHEAIGRALYGPSRFNAFECFRDSGKTTLLRVFTSQRIAYAISRVIMYVSVSQKHASFSLRWLKRQIEHNTKWTQTFGLKKGDKWTDEHLEIWHETAQCYITVIAAGVTGQIRGFNLDDFRPDLIIIDDVLDDENTKTPDQRAKIEELLFGALLNSLAPQAECPFAKAVFLQTPFHRADAIEKCMRDPEWNPIRFSCFNEKGESRWPERYPVEVLQKAKEAAIRRGQFRLWMREKECQIVSGEEKSIDVTRFKIIDVLPESMDVIIAIDPASSDAPTADDHAIGAIGFKGVDVYILDYRIAKGVMPDKAANDFFQLLTLYPNTRKAAVETISYQRVLKWYLEQEMIKRRQFVTIDAIQDKRSKADRIMQAIPGYVNWGHFWVRAGMTELVTQADDYDPEVRDQPDDLLDMIATAIISYNPALRSNSDDELEGEYRRVEEEEYPRLNYGGAP